MGLIFSRFKKKKTTLEVLEGLENKIKSFEENQLSTEQRQRKVVGQLIVFSVGLYVIFAFVFYFCFFAAELRDQIIYLIPLLVFPILVLCLRRLLKWYYHRKLLHNHDKLSDMRNQKKKLLEEVMEKETYKVAKQILEKFAPDQLRKTQVIPASPQVRPPLPRPQLALPPGSVSEVELRRRSLGQLPHQPGMSTSFNTNSPPHLAIIGQSNGQGYSRPPALVGPGPPMPRPVFPRERSYLDKMVEYLLGDGPSNRYALICKQCESHNGMALKEEFEYFSFRCCYCYFWNPARKQRPTAPALTPPLKDPSSEHSSSSELNSASDSEEDSEEELASEVDNTSPQKQDICALKPVQTSESKPVQASELKPVQASESKPVQASELKPVQASESKPVQASEPKPVQASESKPVQASELKPVQASELEPVQASELKPVQASEPKPVEAFELNPVQVLDVKETADDPAEKTESKVEKPLKDQQENVPEFSNEMIQEPTEQ